MTSDDAPPGEGDGGERRGPSVWFLVFPVAIAIVAAALAFVLLAPPHEELLANPDKNAVAMAMANAETAPQQP